MKLATRLGVLRSLAMYHGNPLRYYQLRRAYRPLISPGDLCFDIGAHVGSRCRVWRALGAKVIAVEPQPQCMALLRRWYGEDPQVVLVDHAIGEREGETTFYISERHPTVSTVSERWQAQVKKDRSFASVRWNQQITVPMTTLDRLIARHGVPRFCKIDVEGGELSVLRGLSAPLPLLSFEFIRPVLDQAVDCVERLAELGEYRFNIALGERQHLRQSRWLSAAELINQLPAICRTHSSGDIYARCLCLADDATEKAPINRG